LSDFHQVLHGFEIVLLHGFFNTILLFVGKVLHQCLRKTILGVSVLLDLGHSIKEPSKRPFVPLSERKRLWVREQDVEYLHASLVWIGSIDLEHQVVKVANVFHPASCVEIRLLLEHKALNSEVLDPSQQFHKTHLVVLHIVWNELLALLVPLVSWSKSFDVLTVDANYLSGFLDDFLDNDLLLDNFRLHRDLLFSLSL